MKTFYTSAAVVALAAGAAQAQEITVLVEGGGLMLQQEMAEQFTEETGIEVNFVEVPYQGVFDRLSAEIASGTSNFDVATIDVVWNAAFADHVEDLSDLFTEEVRSDLPQALIDDANVDGRMIGMPAWANAEVVFYRKDLFESAENQEAFAEEYGYDLAPPQTWQQWRDMAEFFTTEDMMGTSVNGLNPEEWMAHVLQAGSPGVVLDEDGTVILDNEAHRAALEFYRAPLCEDGSAPENALEIGWGEEQNLFYQGQTAMMKFWAHAYRLTPEDSQVSGRVGVAPMIAGEAGIAGIPGPWYNVVPSTSENKEAAKQFVAYAIANNGLGIEAPLGLAAANSAYESYMDTEGYEHFEPLLTTLSAPATQGRPIHPDYQELLDQAVIPAFQGALECDDNVGELLEEAAEIARDILDQ
ncbi:ABC transporter substrate-binding protein [Histidinibacterium aquaticum]|uniref:Sugar ABC transporter substrate-binding protein n=1 Tax=Histidinibacterium aquaticum TaxID=2613962 RepID=A0A5J5GNT2_9RHOB|nr:sugar ABC transporter substrate-binding protein [Histidinibacterium aquaticum]KAA9010011.1 sugar ABC transporter substrate-binding protein [Histidinibacterium aquaticum]